MNQNADYYALATLQVSDKDRPWAKPFPCVISLNPDNTQERERLHPLVMLVLFLGRGPRPMSSFLIFQDEPLVSQPNTPL